MSDFRGYEMAVKELEAKLTALTKENEEDKPKKESAE